MRYSKITRRLLGGVGFLWLLTAYPVASVDLTDKGGAVGPTAFGGNNKFYVGASAVGADATKKTFALSRIELERKDGAWAIKEPIAMAPATNIDLNGKAITHIAIGKDGNPVVAVDGDGSHVQVVTGADGATFVKNAAPIKDSAGVAAVKIHSLVATQNDVPYGAVAADKAPLIFATVSSNAGWNAGAGRGVSMINQTTGVPFDAATNRTVAISVDGTATSLSSAVATFEANAAVDTCWSEPQKLLYVALSGLKTGGADGDAAVGLAVGKITPATVSFALEPVVPPAIFNTADAKGNKTYIVGAATSGATSGIIDLFKVRTMHTSTGKDYVVVNGGVRIDPDPTRDDAGAWVFALPVNADTGKLLNKEFSGDAATAGDLLSVERGAPNSADFQRASVGANAGYLTSVAMSVPIGAGGATVAANAVGGTRIGGGSELLANSVLKKNSTLGKGTTIGGPVTLAGGAAGATVVRTGTDFGAGTQISSGITLPAKMLLAQKTIFLGPITYVFDLNLKRDDLQSTFLDIPQGADLMTVLLLGGLKLTLGSTICGSLENISEVKPDGGTESFILPAGTVLGKGTLLKKGSIFLNGLRIVQHIDGFAFSGGNKVVIPAATPDPLNVTLVDGEKEIGQDVIVTKDAGVTLHTSTRIVVAQGSIFKNVVLGGDLIIVGTKQGLLKLGEGSVCLAGTTWGNLVRLNSNLKLRADFVLTKDVLLGAGSKLEGGSSLSVPTGKCVVFNGETSWGGGLFNPDGDVTLGDTMVLALRSTIANDSTIVEGSIIRNDRSVNAIRITDMQVVGDTVFVSLAEKRTYDPSADAGVFTSTPLFGEDGFIKDWTPWQRVTGPDAVKGFGFDEQSNNVWYVTTNDGAQLAAPDALKDYTKAKVTTWGQGTTIDPVVGGKQLLNSNFSVANLGMVNVVDFSDETPGFKQSGSGSWPYFSMRVAMGYGQVALIQTGNRVPCVPVHGTDTIFQPTAAFAEDVNTFVFDEKNDASKDVLPKLGLITCAELSRMLVPDSGWLFVGGTGGVAVLTKTDGTGFDGNAGLEKFSKATDDSFPGGSKWKFVQLVDVNGKALFPDVRKLIAVGVGKGKHWLYILTRTALYRIEMKKENFTDGKIASANVQTVASIAESPLTGAIKSFTSGDEFYDMMVIMRIGSATPASATTRMLFATSCGLYETGTSDAGIDLLTDVPTLTVKDVTLEAASFIEIPMKWIPFHFDFISSTYGDNFVKYADVYGLRGNLYVTGLEPDIDATDARTTIKVCVYRFYVEGARFRRITEQYKDASGVETPYFYSLGTVNIGAFESNGQIDFMALSRHVGNLFIEKLSMLPDSSNFTKTTALDLGQSVSGLHFGSVRRNLANGSLCVPFQNGLSVNE